MSKRLLAVCLAVLLLVMPGAGLVRAANVDYTHHVNWMQEVGLLGGRPQGLELDASITRAELAALLQRALAWPIPQQPVAIKDVAKTNWAYQPLQAALSQGVLTLEHGKVNPTAVLSAYEAFAMAKRADLTLKLGPSAELSRGQLLHALGEALTKTLTVVHTNDTHGRILQDDAKGILGWERVATIVEETRNQNPYTLVLDAGDAIHGTNEAQFFHGASVINAMNSVGVDVMVPGNHDFNYGQEHLLALEQDAAFDIVSANVLKGPSGSEQTPLLTPYVIRELAGLKVAIFGLCSVDTPTLTHPKNVLGLQFNDPAVSAKTLLAELPPVDCVIALTHLGFDLDRQLAAEVPGIDLIIGGHSHTEALTAEKVNDTYIAQAGEWTKFVGREHLIFYKGNLVDVISTPVASDASIPASARTGKLAAAISERVQKEMQTIIGQATTVLDGERAHVRSKETNLGNLIADVMRSSTGADVAMTNGGGIRASIPAGDISVNTIKTVLPFGNTLATIQLTGAQLISVLEHSVRLSPETNGGFMQVSGLSFRFDPSKPAGERVVAVNVNGVALDKAAKYTVATNDFTAAGGDGFTAFMEGTSLVNTGISLDVVLMDYIRAEGKISAQVDGRISVVGK